MLASDRFPSWLRAVVAAALAAALAWVGPAHAADVDFFADDAAQETVLSEMAIHPASLRIGSVTYIAYQGIGFDPYVAAYDDATDTWSGPFRAGTNPLRLDAHGAPALYADATGRLHVIYGSHSSPMYHSRTVAPGEIDVWEDLPVIDDVGTYPQVFPAPDGRMMLFHRGPSLSWSMRISDESGTSFGPGETVLAGGSDAAFYCDFRPGSDGVVHAAFVWLDIAQVREGEPFARHHVYYMRRGADGEWRNSYGTALQLPLGLEQANADARIVDTGEELVNEISVKEDDTGAPGILFLRGIDSGTDAYSWQYARFNGAGWQSTVITTTDHFFDSGAFVPHDDGAIEALLVTGDSNAANSANGAYRGRGGRIDRWLSADRGLSWSRDTTITPEEPKTIFGDPQFVIGGQGVARAVFTEWTNDESLFFHRVFLWGDSGLVSREIEPEITRLAGAHRVDTALAVSRRSFPEGARTVILATQKEFPDALAGAPLAAELAAPVLLTSSAGLSAGVAEEIRRLGARRVVILGGTGALSSGVEADIARQFGRMMVERVAGATRFDTALAIARRMHDPTKDVDEVVVVSGRDWPDAASGAPLAGSLGCPIVLTEPTKLPEQMATLMSEWESSEAIVVGGSSVVGQGVIDELPNPTRVSGADRYATSAAVAAYGSEHALLPYRALVATGRDFPDALTGAGLASRLRGPVLLTRQDSLSASATAYLEGVSDRLFDVYLIGEEDVVGHGVEQQIRSIVQ